jgi:quercetin dioxygenase-like cupin family protein
VVFEHKVAISWSAAGPPDHPDRFHGAVKVQQLLETTEAIRVQAVFFKDGARTKPHVHVNDQVLYCVDGDAVVGVAEGDSANSQITRLRPGDTVRVPRGTWHWHGASSGIDMCHLSMNMYDEHDRWTDLPQKDWAEFRDE